MNHDPTYKKRWKQKKICHWTSEVLTNDGIELLETFLSVRKESSNTETIICLDIKDYGYEECLVKLLNKYDLQDRVYYISWIPEVLQNLGNYKIRNLYFSYIPLHNILIKKILTHTKYFSITLDRFNLHITWTNYWLELKYQKWYQRIVIWKRLPDHLYELLKKSNWGICVHNKFCNKKYLKYIKEIWLKVWIFGISNKKIMNLVWIQNIDWVFSENAKSFS